ncbi:MAG: DUF11 domain-containing protein [Acidobacteriota bacterium]
MIALLLFATAASSCAQEKPKRMIPGPSVKELVPESPNEKEDGISQIIFAQLFKPAPTEYKHVGTGALKNAPPLPTGYTLYKDRIYEVKTQAIITSAFNITVFNLPSAENEQEFKKLDILHLKYDLMSPAGKSWEDVTLFTENTDERIFHYIPKTKYDSLQPDFKSRRIAGISDEFGIFAVAFAPESEPGRAGPFPKVTLKATSSPEPVQAGEEVTHTLTFTNEGNSAAAEVNVKEVLIQLEYVSATSNQGICQQKGANNIIVCHLGVLPGGTSATITIVARSRAELIREDTMPIVTDIEVVFKQTSTDFVDERGQMFSQFTTTVVKKKEPRNNRLNK